MLWEITKAVVTVVVIGLFALAGLGFIGYFFLRLVTRIYFYIKYNLLGIDISPTLKEVLEDIYEKLDKEDIHKEDVIKELYLASTDPTEKRIYNDFQVNDVKYYLKWYGKNNLFDGLKNVFKKRKNDRKKRKVTN